MRAGGDRDGMQLLEHRDVHGLLSSSGEVFSPVVPVHTNMMSSKTVA